MHPFEAISAKEALQLMQQHGQFDVGLLDLHMPEMDGLSLAEEIRQRPQEEHFPLLILTSLTDHKIKERAEALTQVDCLTKPIKPSSIYDKLTRWFWRACCNHEVNTFRDRSDY